MVYTMTGSNLLGFVNLGDINDDLQALEWQLNKNIVDPCITTYNYANTYGQGHIYLEFPYAISLYW